MKIYNAILCTIMAVLTTLGLGLGFYGLVREFVKLNHQHQTEISESETENSETKTVDKILDRLVISNPDNNIPQCIQNCWEK